MGSGEPEPPRRPLVGCFWGRGDEIAFFSGENDGMLMNKGRRGGDEAWVKVVSWDQVPQEMRHLVFDGHRAFVELQELQKRVDKNGFRPQGSELRVNNSSNGENFALNSGFLLKTSSSLRATFDRSLKRLEKRIRSTDFATDDDSSNLAGFLKRMKLGNAAWHLCEILTLRPDEHLSGYVAHWAFKHFPKSEDPLEYTRKQLDVRNNGSESAYFWDVIFHHTVQGNLLSAWQFLSLDKQCERACASPIRSSNNGAFEADMTLTKFFQGLRRLLLSMPHYEERNVNDGIDSDIDDKGQHEDENIYSKVHLEDLNMWKMGAIDSNSEKEFSASWQAWSIELNRFSAENKAVINQLDANDRGSTQGNFRLLFDLLLGDAKILGKVSHRLNEWPYLLAFVLRYQAPTLPKWELGSLVSDLMDKSSMHVPTDSLQVSFDENKELFLNIFNLQYLRVVQQLHELVGDRWYEAHIVEFLAQAHAIETVSVSGSLRQISRMDEFSKQDFLLGDLEVDIREWFLLAYAAQLGLGGRQPNRNAYFGAGWRLAADYLAALTRSVDVPQFRVKELANPINEIISEPTFEYSQIPLGLLSMEMILDRHQPLNDSECLKLINGCKAMNLPFKSIVFERMMRWWSFKGGRGRFRSNENGLVSFSGVANALVWASKFGYSIKNLLGDIFEKGDIKVMDLLVESLTPDFYSCLGSSIHKDDNEVVEFLADYSSLHQYMREATEMLKSSDNLENDENSAEIESALILRDKAAQYLFSLLRLDLIPPRMYHSLMKKVLLWKYDEYPIILESIPCMRIDQVSCLQGFLEDPFGRKFPSDCSEDELSLLRVMLVSMLTAATIRENSKC